MQNYEIGSIYIESMFDSINRNNVFYYCYCHDCKGEKHSYRFESPEELKEHFPDILLLIMRNHFSV